MLPAALLLMGNDATIVDPLPTLPVVSNGAVIVSVTGLRSEKGLVRACLTADQRFFPNCEKDPHALKASAPANEPVRIRFPAMPSGNYAVTVLHDENSNGKVDMLFGIPREGVGFSRNPTFSFGPPRFSAARFALGREDVTLNVTMKYFL